MLGNNDVVVLFWPTKTLKRIEALCSELGRTTVSTGLTRGLRALVTRMMVSLTATTAAAAPLLDLVFNDFFLALQFNINLLDKACDIGRKTPVVSELTKTLRSFRHSETICKADLRRVRSASQTSLSRRLLLYKLSF